jgi:hypothetical protein
LKVLVGKHETETCNLEDPDTNRRKILKRILQKYGGMGQTDLPGKEQGQAADYCEVGNEALHSMIFYQFLYLLRTI